MNKIFSALVSFLVTVVPIILALHQPAVDADGAVGQMCATMSAAQLASMEAVRLANTSCMYNISIGPAGVILH